MNKRLIGAVLGTLTFGAMAVPAFADEKPAPEKKEKKAEKKEKKGDKKEGAEKSCSGEKGCKGK